MWHLVHAHDIVGVEIRLFDRAAGHGALAVQQSRETVDERAGDLPLDLRRVDRVTRVGRGADAMDLEASLRTDRDLGTAGDVAAKPHDLREPVISPGRRVAVPSLVRCRLEYGEMARLQDVAAKLERILPGRMGQLVDKAF